MRGLIELLKRFRSDERGAFLVLFGVMAIVLVAMAGAAVDYTAMQQARSVAQNALDSAALGLAPTIYDDEVTADTLQADAEALVVERVNRGDLTIDIDQAVPNEETGTLHLEGTITVPMAFVQLVGIQTLTARIVAEATRGSTNLEVAVALDTTGSMSSDIDDLQDALATLIPIVVKDQQEPTYSKMALAPYSAAVNVGSTYADGVRGAIPGSKDLSKAEWWNSQKDVTGATQARPVVITAANHGFSNGDRVVLTDVRGMTEINNNIYVVTNKTTNTFELYTTGGARVDGRYYDAYQTPSPSSLDKVNKCIQSSCNIVITTSSSHGFDTNDYVRLTGISNAMSGLNNSTRQITKLTDTTFSIPVRGSSSYDQPMTTGDVWCTTYGCEYYRISSSTTYRATASCVTEPMTDSFTDEDPADRYVSINYTSNGGCSIGETILPLTSSKEDLLAYTEEGGLVASGSTAGQIGTAWAWYLVSPNFADIFTGESAPAEYDAPNTMKVVIIMTDGEYNTQYCNGVDEDRISCDPPDGITGTMSGPFGQAEDLCHNMKEAGVIVYTVGFDLDDEGDAVDVLAGCASDPSKAKRASDGAGLVAAFEEIGQDISDLRLSM